MRDKIIRSIDTMIAVVAVGLILEIIIVIAGIILIILECL
jgi:hypothetical protein